MGHFAELFAYFFKDMLQLISSAVVVSSTTYASFLETYLSHLLAGQSRSEIVSSITSTPLLAFYYLTMAFFIAVSAVLVLYYLIRFVFEALLLSNPALEKSAGSRCCMVQGLRFTLLFAFFLLFALFCCFWLFWGPVLATAYTRIALFLEQLALGAKVDESAIATLPPTLHKAVDRMIAAIVVLLVVVSLNVLIVMRIVYNKLVLLGPNLREEGNRVSFFRVLPVNLVQVGRSSAVFRQLWVSFVVDVLELVTLIVWVLYPLYVVGFWVIERRCSIDVELLPSVAVSPLIACAVEADRFFLALGCTVLGLLVLLIILYVLRFVEERSKLIGGQGPRFNLLVPFIIILGFLMLLSIVGMVVAMLMFANPLMSNTGTEEHRISLAYPGLILLAGSFFVLLYIGKKITFALSVYVNPDVSFFFESGCSIIGKTQVNNLAPTDTDEAEISLKTFSELSEPLLL